MPDINWLEITNIILASSGFMGWCWVWFVGQYQTGETKKTQIGVMVVGFIWLSLIIADTIQSMIPTTATLSARIFLILACYLLSPLLHENRSSTIKPKDD